MPDDTVLHVDVNLDVGRELITGSVCVANGTPVSFVGMVELLSLLDRARDLDVMTGTTPKGDDGS